MRTRRVRYLRLVAHVYDFLASGERSDLTRFKEEMSKKYELKVQIAGWENGDEKEFSFLGRTIRTTPFGVELEGYEKHAKLMEDEWDMKNCNPSATPYAKPTVSFNRIVEGKVCRRWVQRRLLDIAVRLPAKKMLP